MTKRPHLAAFANKKGEPRRGGRKPGTPNHTTQDLRRMILGALSDVGGQKYLADQARRNPAVFCSLVGKVLPLQVSGDAEGEPIKARVEIAFITPDDA